MNYKLIVLILLAAEYLYSLLLIVFRIRSMKNPVPANVADVYDPDTYRKWRNYKGEKSRLSVISETASFIIAFLLMALDAYAAFAGLFPQTLFLQMLPPKKDFDYVIIHGAGLLNGDRVSKLLQVSAPTLFTCCFS